MEQKLLWECKSCQENKKIYIKKIKHGRRAFYTKESNMFKKKTEWIKAS